MTGAFQQARPYDAGEPFDVSAALANMQGFHKGEQQNALGQLQLQMEQVKAERSKEAWALQQEMLKKMTPEQRMAFTYAPTEAGGALAKQLYPEQKPIAVAREGSIYDPATKTWISQGSDGSWSPAAPGPGANLAAAAPGTTQAPAPAPAGAVPPGGTGTAAPASAVAPRRFADAIKSGENTTGNPAQTNLAGTSSAMGDHQFIDRTWLALMRSKHPELVAGKTDKEILNLRAKPELSAEMADAYAMENAPILTGAGFEANPVNLALAHRYGPAGAVHILQAEKANPNAPLSSVLPEAELNANKELRNLTIAQGRQAMEKQMAGAVMPGQPLPITPGGTGAPAPVASGNPNIRVEADGWETRIDRNGVPVTKGAKPGEFWQRRRIGGTDKDPVYEYRTGGGAGAGGPFEGTGDGQFYNQLITGDPSSQAYALAYHHMTKPQYVTTTDPNDPTKQVTTAVQPNLPPNIRKPTYQLSAAEIAQADAAGSPGTTTGSAVANPPATGTEVPGTKKGGKPKELKDAEVEVSRVKSAITEYREVLKRTGGPGFSSAAGIPTKDASDLNTAYNNLALLVKGDVLYQLGVLNGPDLQIVRRTLLDPSTLKAWAADPKVFESQIASIEKLIDDGIKAKRQQYDPASVGGDTGNFSGMSREALLAVDPSSLNDGQKAAYLNALKAL